MFFEACYGKESSTWVFSNEGVYQLMSTLGIHQGDPLGCIAFAMAVQRLFEAAEKIAEEGQGKDRGAAKAYIDDFSVGATVERMLRIVKLIMEEGSKIGVEFNLSKTIILLGKCSTWEEASSRQQMYVSAGFKVDNVMIHPDNEVDALAIAAQRRKYGTICLGIPIGDREYVHSQLEDKLKVLRSEGEKLLDYRGSTQSKMLMLRFSFAQKATHLLRCIPPSLTGKFALSFNNLKLDLFCSILGLKSSDFSEMQKEQVFTHIRDGGFGLGNSVATAPAAYVASVAAAMEVLEYSFAGTENVLRADWLASQNGVVSEEVFEAWSNLPEIVHLTNSSKWLSHLIHAVVQLKTMSEKAPPITQLFDREELSLSKLQKVLFKPYREKHLNHMLADWGLNRDIQRYKSCVGNREDASAWLEAYPAKQFELQNEDYRIACILRLGVAFPEISRLANERGNRNHHKCFECCKNKKTDSAVFDDYGHHFAHSCKRGSGRTNTHNAIRDAAFQMYRDLGKFAEREVTLSPLSLPTDNAVIEGVLEVQDGDNSDGEDENGNEESTQDNTGNLSMISGASVSNEDGPQAYEIPQLHKRRADIVLYDNQFTIVEISITNPCLGFPIDQSSTVSKKTKNTAEQRSKDKIRKYRRDRIVDDSGRRVVVPFVLEIFGRMDPITFASIKDLSRDVLGKGYASAQFRMYWFQRISCALQRMHAAFFKRNLGIARDELKPGSCSVSPLIYESMGYASSGFGSARAF